MGDVSNLSSQQCYEKAVNGVLQMQQSYTVLPVAPPAASDMLSSTSASSLPLLNLLTHGHLVNYGGK